MIKAIIFDCFGVLVGLGFDDTYRHAGGDPVADTEFIEELLERANQGMITQVAFRKAITDQIGISADAYEKAVSKAEQPNKELLDYILDLKKTYKTAILSNVNSGVLERKIDPVILKKSFDELVISADEGFMKPQPEIYQITAKRLGVAPDECVFTDDREGYLHGAQSVGMQTILYQNFAQFKTELEKILAADTNNNS